MKTVNKFHITRILGTILLSAVANIGFGQTPEQTAARELLPDQIVEREITGKATHRYQFDLRTNEFFQVRVEQKGVDVTLKLLDEKGNVLAMMGSPNDKEGSETLTFVANANGGFILEVDSPNEKAEKGNYTIKREASRTANDKDKRRVEIEKIFDEAIKATHDVKNRKQALSKLEEAVKGWKELGDDYLIGLTANQIENVENLIKTEARVKALIEEFQFPLKLQQEGQKLLETGTTESVLAARAKYFEALEASRTFFKRMNDESIRDILNPKIRGNWKQIIKQGEVSILNAIAHTHDLLREWEEGISHRKLALEVIQEMRQNPEITGSEYFLDQSFPLKMIEADTIGGIETAFKRLNKLQESLAYSEKALTLWSEVQKEHENFRATAEVKEALLLGGMGQNYETLNERKKALEYFEKALVIYGKLPDQKSQEALTLKDIAGLYFKELNYGKSFEYDEKALKIYEEINDKPSQASILLSFGVTHLALNDEQKSREFYKRALEVLLSDDYYNYYENEKPVIPMPSEYSSVKTANESAFYKDEREWSRYGNIGLVYRFLNENEKELEAYQKSLTFARSAKNQEQIRLSLNSIGSFYSDRKEWNKALEHYKQSLDISRQLPDRNSVANNFSDIAYVFFELKDWENARQNAFEALRIYQALGAENERVFLGYTTMLNILSRIYFEQGNKKSAIFYGKQTVNAIQRERKQLEDLDLASQKAYLKRYERIYRRLAEWLIESGRLVEAEQVLSMLKEEEVTGYLRRDRSFAGKLDLRIDFTPAEKKAVESYQKNAETLAAIGLEFSRLEDLKRGGVKLSGEQERRFEELKIKQAEANKDFQNFLNALAEEFKNNKNPEKDLRENFNLKSDLKSFGEGVVFVYTLVGEDKFSSILVTLNAQIPRQEPKKAAELNAKIAAFREAVKNPNINPRPIGKELYDILIKPIENDLAAAKAKTILWHLDGNLRLLPLAALWDGKHYFGQQYQNVVITGKSLTRIGRDVAPNPNVLGLGVSDAKTVPETLIERKFIFNALPSVPFELASIVKTKKSPNGVLPGESLLNAEFTRKNFAEQLLKGYRIVHIASHFSINAGDASRSFLLLGDGTTLTVSDLNVDPSFENKFADVELLTLSACDTAVGETDSNGKEVEGFAYVAQQNGARAILATLWSVADNSTQLLMSEFYRLRKERPNLTKAEAMQAAQQAMISGRLQSSGKSTGCRSEIVNLSGTEQTAFKCDGNAPFAHPYFWSPFVLIGNWR